MECDVDRKEFLAAVKMCRPVANGRVKPILGCVRMTFSVDTCVLQATNGYKAIQLSVPVEGTVEGVYCVSCDLLANILNSPSGEKIKLTLGEKLTIKTTSATHKLLLTDPKEFPALPGAKETLARTTGAVLAKSIQRVVYACSSGDGRYAFEGVMFDVNAESWTLVATDGRRLSVCAVGSKGESSKEWNPIIPSDDCRFLAGLLNEDETEVAMGVTASGSSLVFSIGPLVFWSRMIEGRFPAYRDFVPTGLECKASSPVSPLLNAVNESRLYTDKEHRGVEFRFSEDDGLLIAAELGTIGSAEISVPVLYDGKPLTISMDARLVADFLSPLGPGDRVTISFKDAEKPALFQADGGKYYSVVMPLCETE